MRDNEKLLPNGLTSPDGHIANSPKTENRRKRQGHQFRVGHVIWSAFKIASFLWIPIGLYHCCCASDRHKNNNNAGSYARIDQQQGGANNNNGWYGAPAPSAPTYGAGYVPPQGKFEPMGYAGAAGTNIPLAPMNAPLPQQQQQQQQMGMPVAASAPPAQMMPMATGYTVPGTPAPPPPYQSPAQQAPVQTGGAAQGYYSGAHSGSTYAPSVVAPTPSPTPPVQQYQPPTSYAPVATPPAPIAYPQPTSYAPGTAHQQPSYMSATYAPQQNAPYYGQ